MINHVLVIPDGNRRFAKSKDIDLGVVYKFISDYTTTGLIKFFLLEKNAKELTIFGISRDNVIKREKKDLDPIYDAQIDLYKKWLNDKEIISKVKFTFPGDKQLLPKDYSDSINALENATKKNNGNSAKCNILVAYNGQWEIIEAFKKAKAQGKEPTQENLYEFLQINTPIDLIIRPGYEKRFSSCPIYQTSYSEFIFPDYFYPELTMDNLRKIVEEYNKRERRYGK
jgi:undecaprenyl diphosphate synthase